MHFVLIGIILLALLFGPQVWARYVFRRHSGDRADLPGTGGELARHLLDRFDMTEVAVEPTDRGDHYDPQDRVVRLSPQYYAGRSLSAIAVAAHEVSHAIQHRRGERMLALRSGLVRLAMVAEKVGAAALVAMPLIAALTRAPSVGLLAVGIASLGVSALVHLVTLPVELDASFGKALPLLKAGQYIREEDEPAVRQVLRAAALTYVAASLAGLLNLWRWLRLLRWR